MISDSGKHRPKITDVVRFIDFKNLEESLFKENVNKLSSWNLINQNRRAKNTNAYQRGYCSELIMMEIYKKGLESFQEYNYFDKKSQGVYFDFIYSLVDIFNNDTFNMERLKFLDFSDLKKEKYKDFKEMTKEEKKLYRESKKENVRKLKEEAIARIEKYKSKGKSYFFVKIRNTISDKNLNFNIPFSEEEIYMAKRCIQNGWEFPPPAYFESSFKKSHKKDNDSEYYGSFNNHINSVTTFLGINKSSNKSSKKITTSFSPNKSEITSNFNIVWSKEMYHKIINYKPEIYQIENPLTERGDGSWISYEEFSHKFNSLIVYHNPRTYLNSLTVDLNWYDYFNDVYDLNSNFEVIHLTPIYNNLQYYSNTKINNSKSALLIIIEFNSSKDSVWDDLNCYLIIDLVDKNGCTIYKNKIFNKSFNTFQFDDLVSTEEYFIKVQNGLMPFGFVYTIHSDFEIEKLSYNNYLKERFNYNIMSFKNEHGVIAEKSFYSFDKLVIKVIIQFKLLIIIIIIESLPKLA